MNLRTLFLTLFLAGAGGCSRADVPQSAAPPASAPQAAAQTTEQKAEAEWQKLKALYKYDAAAPLDAKLVRSSDNIVASFARWTIRGAQGATVPLYLIKPSGASAAKPLPAVVVLHGKDQKIEDMTPIGVLLASRGYIAIIPEIDGHGERRDAKNLLFNGDSKRLRDGLLETVQDVRRTLDFAATRPEIDANRIGVLGVSLGAILGSMATAVDERLKTAVFIVGGADWQIILRESQENFARGMRAGGETDEAAKKWRVLDDVDPQFFMAHIAPRAALFINAKRDGIIPQASADKFFANAREPKKQILFDSGHVVDPNLVAPPALEWLETNLKKVPQAATVALR